MSFRSVSICVHLEEESLYHDVPVYFPDQCYLGVVKVSAKLVPGMEEILMVLSQIFIRSLIFAVDASGSHVFRAFNVEVNPGSWRARCGLREAMYSFVPQVSNRFHYMPRIPR